MLDIVLLWLKLKYFSQHVVFGIRTHGRKLIQCTMTAANSSYCLSRWDIYAYTFVKDLIVAY